MIKHPSSASASNFGRAGLQPCRLPVASGRARLQPCRTTVAVLLCLLFGSLVALAAPQSDYLIGPKDVLLISVFEQPDLSGKFTVEADGTFTFPLVGRVKAGGLTVRQFEAELKKSLTTARLFNDPQLTAAIDQYGSQHIYVVGEVRTPGNYILNGDMTLIEALARAGSTTANASDEVIVVHAAPGKVPAGPTLPDASGTANVERIDLRRLQTGSFQQNAALKDGDTIFVPRAETIYVTGQVKSPGAWPLQTKDTTVMQALSLAGGVTDRAASNRIEIIRMVDGKERRVKAKLSDRVLPGDTLFVPERWI